MQMTQLPQHVQICCSYPFRLLAKGCGGFSLGRFWLLFSLLLTTLSIKFSNISFTFWPDLAEVSAKGILYF